MPQSLWLAISSLSAVVHLPLMGPYTAAKAGVEAFADALRLEVAHTGTKVGVAYFGFIDTDMVRDAYAHPASAATRKGSPGFMTRPIPVSAAGAAIERGVLRRARVTYAPRFVGPMLRLRGVLQPAVERGMLARPQDTIEAISAAQTAERQDGDAPTGTHVNSRYAKAPAPSRSS